MNGPRPQRGFTLMEILGALVLLSLLMLGVYAGIRAATHTVESGNAALQRTDAMRAAQDFVRRELGQARALPWARDAHGGAVFFVGTPHTMQFVAPLPGYLGRLGPQLQILRLVPDHPGLRLEVAFARLPPDGSKPQAFGQPQVLLRGIRQGGFAYMAPPTDTSDPWTGTWPDYNAIPQLVQVKLALDQGAWPLLRVAPRVDSGAVQAVSSRLPVFGGTP